MIGAINALTLGKNGTDTAVPQGGFASDAGGPRGD